MARTTVLAGETWASIAERTTGPGTGPAIAAANGQHIDTRPDEGSKVDVPGWEGDADAAEERELDTTKRGALPEDFPGKAALDTAGLDTYGKVRAQAAKAEGLTAVEGIGAATEAKILDALGPDDEEGDEEES